MTRIAFIGFGEAGGAFAPACVAAGPVRAYDCKTSDPATREGKIADCKRAGVVACDTAADALDNAEAVLSLVTADQALAAARAGGPHLGTGSLWLDANSVAPDTKRAAAETVEAAGGRYVDVAVMAPVYPARSNVPLLVSGPHAADAVAMLANLGFTSAKIVPGAVGRAAAIKMIRSVVVKGIEALTAECLLAAHQAGVLDDVLASLDDSPTPAAWPARADYNLGRMIEHGLRRAAEMEEVVKTLDAIGTGSAMTRGTVVRQRDIGALRLSPGGDLGAKLGLLNSRKHAA